MTNNDWQAVGQEGNCEDHRQQHGENQSAHVATIGALIGTEDVHPYVQLLTACEMAVGLGASLYTMKDVGRGVHAAVSTAITIMWTMTSEVTL